MVERLQSTLTAQGITCCDYEHDEERNKNVLLLFNLLNLTEDLCAVVLEHTRQADFVLLVNMGELPAPPRLIWELLEKGAADVLHLAAQPKAPDIIRSRLERKVKIEQLLDTPTVRDQLVGASPQWMAALRQIVEIAHFTQDSVLILGESGTGKELAARLVHNLDTRPLKKDMVLLDCSTIVSDLSGSEFFGHEKGAFTNAIALREGAFCLADRGTLFLDEIGELPLGLQSELLRVIQEGTYKRVGSNHWKQTNFRLVCATNRNLLREVQQHQFREDLYYRISTWVVTLPSLRDRREDIPALAQFFLEKSLAKSNVPALDAFLINYLVARDYPGNVRELQQLITRIAHRYVGKGPLTISDLPAMDRPNVQEIDAVFDEQGFVNALRRAVNNGWNLKDIVSHVSDRVKDIAIISTNDDLQAAAHLLSVSDRTMQIHKAARRSGPDVSAPSAAMGP